MSRILVVDDKDSMRTLLARVLGEAHQVVTAADGLQALALLRSQPFDAVLSDIRMPGADGFEVLKAVKEATPETEVLLMTAYASIDKAVEAMKLGAFDYLEKPFEPDQVALLVAQAVERKRLRAEARPPKAGGAQRFERLLGKSPSMLESFSLLERAAGTEVTVLILGETGTGKELAARAVHARSARSKGPFVPVNCAAIPTELIESELFGHAKGAFTGAQAAHHGLFEEARGGTLFLDEVGELPLAVQAKLNRALQERQIRRVGDTPEIHVDVRVVAATHRDLKAEVALGRFREDLYYRLYVFPIRLPALRDRPEDIPLLLAHFLDKHAPAGRELQGFAPEALSALLRFAWPGNVRELENAVERAIALSTADTVRMEDLPSEIQQIRAPAEGASPLSPEVLVALPYRDVVDLARDQTSKDYLAALMREFHGNVTRAAERAGMERESLHRLLRKYGVRSDDFKV